MATDVQICSDCGWQLSGQDKVNPHRKKCPECGAYYFGREEVQWFGGNEPGYKP
ncbi:hypothetical protein [Halorubrum cibi]|uniref:Uncharacterized protein n=1 Tax=Halorubrum cibi TaxID=413815 RepID=A0A521EE51_9EURY|nr:hypothetical protein [Halorubrum cibi]SMO81460.1 hypothetical protein SAMN06264867_11018 [Halorubrum cibi]